MTPNQTRKIGWLTLAGFGMVMLGWRACMVNAPFAILQGRSQTQNEEIRPTVGIGIWNGPTASVYVFEDGANLLFNCAQGYISKKLLLDSENQFKVKGLYTPDGGEVTEVEYTGTIQGAQMILRHDEQIHELIFEGESYLMHCQ